MRWLLARRGALRREVLKIVLRAITAWLCRPPTTQEVADIGAKVAARAGAVCPTESRSLR